MVSPVLHRQLPVHRGRRLLLGVGGEHRLKNACARVEGAEAFPPFPGEGESTCLGNTSLGRRVPRVTFTQNGATWHPPSVDFWEQTCVDQPELRKRDLRKCPGRKRESGFQNRALHSLCTCVWCGRAFRKRLGFCVLPCLPPKGRRVS